MVSVVICSRNRPDDLERAVAAVLRSDFADFELVVVDQSSDDHANKRAERLENLDKRVRVVRDEGIGLSRARNLSIARTSGSTIVFTDDDCGPDTDWLDFLVRALEGDPSAGIAFGAVVPAECDPAEGFIVGCLIARRRRLRGRLSKCLDGGIGASMAVRREALQAVGGFDEYLGAGGYFPSCEDGDMAYRMLGAGFSLLHVPEARVTHYGLRDWQSGGRLTHQTYLAIAAAYMKHVRRGDPVAALLILQQAWFAAVNVSVSLMRRRRPLGLGRLAGLLAGCQRSFELKINSQSGLYVRDA